MTERRHASRAEWERIRARGRARFLLWNGVMARGVPMAIATVLLIQAFQGELGMGMLVSRGFHARLLGALLLFSAGGALSAFARWKSLELRFQEESGAGDAS